MKRTLLGLAFLTLILPIAARASGIDLVNQFGTVTITNAGIVSHGSQLVQFGSITATPGHALGSVTFSTGMLSSGSIWTGGTFASAGSSFVVTGSGPQVPHIIFVGTFSGPISWTIVDQHNQFVEYKLSGRVVGELYTGRFVSGIETQYIYTYTNQRKLDNKGNIYQGTTRFAVPEPGTLGMLGTGLSVMAGIFRRKIFTS